MMPRTEKRVMFHPDDEERGAPKRGKATNAPPGRKGGRGEEQNVGQGKDETTEDGAGCVYVRGDEQAIADEVQYHIRAQTGTTAGAGKRIRGLGTTMGLPIDEPQHGEVHEVEHEDIEGGNIAINRKRKLAATE